MGSYAPAARELGAQVYLRRLGVSQIRFIKGLRELIESGTYDIVHNHLQVYSGLPALACKSLKIPVITSFHCTEFVSDTWLRHPGLRHMRDAYANVSIRYAIRHSEMVTGCSRAVVECVSKNFGTNGNDWRVLYYGTDPPPHSTKEGRRELRDSLGWPKDTPIIAHVGRFAQQKNHFGLLRIFEIVCRRLPNAKMLLIGGGPLRPAVEAMVQALGLSESVRFLGYRDDVPTLISRSDLFLFPSWFEGLPVAALEASAAGVAVVASKVPGINEAIEEGVTGYLFDPRDHEGMANAAISVLSDPGLGGRVGAAGRNRILEGFSKQISAKSLLHLYHECIG